MIHLEILPCPAVDVAVTVDGMAVHELDVVATVVFVAVVESEIVDTEVTWVWLATAAKWHINISNQIIK